MLGGSATFQPGTQPEGNPVLAANFKINLFVISGLRVESLQLVNENYKPYKVKPSFPPNPKANNHSI